MRKSGGTVLLLKYVIGLLLFLLIAYLPLVSFQFTLKNDAFIYNYPNKHFFSEALHHSFLPTWNPYLNFGFPLYADPGFAWWHPITWIFGLIGYNAYTFTLEVLLYVFIAGCGMYYLCKKLQCRNITAFLCGAIFMCCGFFVGNLQHINFITAAAFIPWVVACRLQLHQRPTKGRMLGAALAIYLLVTAGHPAIPIAMLYFMAFLAVGYWWLHRKVLDLKQYTFWSFSLLLCAFLLLALPFMSWAKLMPLYSRSEPLNQVAEAHIGFTFSSYLSLLTPLPTARGSYFWATDVSMRNGYFALLPFLLALISLAHLKMQQKQKLFFLTAFFGLLLASGGHIKTILYQNLPLLQYIRTNGEFRVFALFSFIAAIAFTLETLWAGHKDLLVLLKRYLWITGLFAFTGLAVSVYYLSRFQSFFSPSNLQSLKLLLDSFSAIPFVAIGCATLLLLVCLLYKASSGAAITVFVIIVLLDCVLNTWMMLPITGVGKASVQQMQQILERAPYGFPKPGHTEVTAHLSQQEKQLIGDWQWYNKDVQKDSIIPYPSKLKTPLTQSLAAGQHAEKNKSFAFTSKSSSGLEVRSFAPNRFVFDVHFLENDTLFINQNYYPGWRAQAAGRDVPVIYASNGRLAVPLTKGRYSVYVHFSLRLSMLAPAGVATHPE